MNESLAEERNNGMRSALMLHPEALAWELLNAIENLEKVIRNSKRDIKNENLIVPTKIVRTK